MGDDKAVLVGGLSTAEGGLDGLEATLVVCTRTMVAGTSAAAYLTLSVDCC